MVEVDYVKKDEKSPFVLTIEEKERYLPAERKKGEGIRLPAKRKKKKYVMNDRNSRRSKSQLTKRKYRKCAESDAVRGVANVAGEKAPELQK